MNDQLARSLFMDYLYEEIDEGDKQKLEIWLEKHPHMQEELNDLRQTRSLLQGSPAGDPKRKLVMLEPDRRSFREWWYDFKSLLPRTVAGKAGFAVAAGLILLLVTVSLMRLHIESTDSGLAVSFGYSPAVDGGGSEVRTEALINRMQQENAAMLEEYLGHANRQNREQLQLVVQYFEQQRINDLQLLNQALDEIQENNDFRLEQTSRFLGQVLQNVSYHDENR